MKKRLNLTIDSDLYADLEKLPRKVSVSEFVNFMLKSMMETAKKGRELTQEELDELIEGMGGKELKEKFVETFGPFFDKFDTWADWMKRLIVVETEDSLKQEG